MSQNDLSIANADGATVRADINSALQANATDQSGATAPGTTYAGQLWWDTGNNLIKKRNGANTAWLTVASFDGTTHIPYRDGTALGTAATNDRTNDGGTVVTTDASSAQNNFDNMPQVGGSPIVERGSNADGFWVRFADNTQIVTKPDVADLPTDTALGNVFTSGGSATWTYPQPFSATIPSASAHIKSSTGTRWPVAHDVGSSSLQLNLFGASTSAIKSTVGAMAIGTWT